MMVSGCHADPYEYVLPAHFKDACADTAFSEALTRLPPEDRALLAEYLVAAAVRDAKRGEPIPEGTTIRQAIAEARRAQSLVVRR